MLNSLTDAHASTKLQSMFLSRATVLRHPLLRIILRPLASCLSLPLFRFWRLHRLSPLSVICINRITMLFFVVAMVVGDFFAVRATSPSRTGDYLGAVPQVFLVVVFLLPLRVFEWHKRRLIACL